MSEMEFDDSQGLPIPTGADQGQADDFGGGDSPFGPDPFAALQYQPDISGLEEALRDAVDKLSDARNQIAQLWALWRITTESAGTIANIQSVSLSTDGGSDGSQTTSPSYTYAVTFDDGSTGFGGKSPANQRSNGSFVPASIGLIITQTDDTQDLWTIDEVPNTNACSTTGGAALELPDDTLDLIASMRATFDDTFVPITPPVIVPSDPVAPVFPSVNEDALYIAFLGL